MQSHSTTDLMVEALQYSREFSEFEDEYQQRYIDENLPDFIQKTMEHKGLSKAQVIKDADLDRTYGYQIMRGLRKPTREKLIQLAFGLKLNAGEAAAMFKTAGYLPLYPKVQEEAAVLFCLQKEYTYLECTIFLDILSQREQSNE